MIQREIYLHDVYFQSVSTILPQLRGLYARLAAPVRVSALAAV